MKHLGGLNLAWWLNEMWTATQEQRDLKVFTVLVSFQCNLMVLWLCQDRVSCGGSSCCQTLGGSIIVGASSLAGMVETPFPKVLSRYHLSIMHPGCIGCLGYLSLKVKLHTLSRV